MFKGYSKGLSMSRPVFSRGYCSSPLISSREIEILKILGEAEHLTTNALAVTTSFSREKTNSILKKLCLLGLICWVNILAESGKVPLKFRLWFPSGTRPPKNAQEACRLAIYGRFYALARKEAIGFSWHVLRQDSVLVVEMLYSKEGGRKRLRIDAPRQNEKPLDWANIHIQCHKDILTKKNSITVVTDDALMTSKNLRELFQNS